MTWALDTPARAGGVALVPIVDRVVSVRGDARRITAHGRKWPAMILVFQEGTVTGFDLQGRSHNAKEIERLYPEAIAKAVARLKQDD